MPLSEPFLTIFEGAIAPACQDVGLRCGNAADIFGPGVIISDIRAQIRDARVLIADVTGRNPNVFYELGVAHEMGNTAIPISQRIEDVPFDAQHHRLLVYAWADTKPAESVAVSV